MREILFHDHKHIRRVDISASSITAPLDAIRDIVSLNEPRGRHWPYRGARGQVHMALSRQIEPGALNGKDVFC